MSGFGASDSLLALCPSDRDGRGAAVRCRCGAIALKTCGIVTWGDRVAAILIGSVTARSTIVAAEHDFKEVAFRCISVQAARFEALQNAALCCRPAAQTQTLLRCVTVLTFAAQLSLALRHPYSVIIAETMAILVLTKQPARTRRLATESGLDVVFDGDDVTMYARLTQSWEMVLIDDDLVQHHPSLVETSVKHAQRTALFMREPDLLRTAAAIRAGACDVLNLPLDIEKVRHLLAGGPVQVPQLENSVLRSPSYEWVGKSPANLEAFLLAARAAASNSNVLIVGEVGVGKELLARIIHDQSMRASGPFSAVNCAAADDTTLAIELFGGQVALNGQEPICGLLSRTATGTLFLDEISQLSGHLQGRLAGVLRERHFSPIGTFERQTLQARLIAAANRDLEDKTPHFREDLLYEFAVKITVAPLRRRGEDIPLLARYFLDRFAHKHKKEIHGFTREALDLLEKYDWPGNVRQLRNVVERAVIRAAGVVIGAYDLPSDLSSPHDDMQEADPGNLALEAFERRHIRRVWRITGGHLGETADLLGIHRNTLRRKLEQYGITEEDARI